MSNKVNKFPVNMYFHEDAGFLFSVLADIIEAKYGDPEEIMEHIPSMEQLEREHRCCWRAQAFMEHIPSMDQLEREHRRYALGQAFGYEAGMEEAKSKKKTTKKKAKSKKKTTKKKKGSAK